MMRTLYLTARVHSSSTSVVLLESLRKAMLKVKRMKKWHLVSKLTRAFVEACMSIRLKTIKSLTLMRAIIKAIKELKEVISAEANLLKLGIKAAWRLSEIASSWGHKNAENWKHSKHFILYQALTLKWLSGLFGDMILGALQN